MAQTFWGGVGIGEIWHNKIVPNFAMSFRDRSSFFKCHGGYVCGVCLFLCHNLEILLPLAVHLEERLTVSQSVP